MRILLVNRNARPHTGGANRVVVETIEILERAGHTVALAYWERETPAVSCQCFLIDGRESYPSDELADAIRGFQPDIVQFHQADLARLEARLAREWPVCHFLHDQSWFCSGGDRMARDFTPCRRPHGGACLFWHYAQGCGGLNPLGNLRRWRRTDARRGLRDGAPMRFQVASEFMKRGLIENHYPESRIDLVPLYAHRPGQTAEETKGLLLVASRLVRHKGVDVLLQALALVKEPEWALAIAGEGPHRAPLEQLAARLGLSARVRFLGELPPVEIDGWYAKSSVVIHPTLRPEPFGLAGPEAMAHGKPVVAFDGGATPEWLADGQTGLLVKDRTAESLAASIERLLRDSALRARLGAGAQKRWERFTPERYRERLLESFDRAICDFKARARPA